MLKIKVRKLYDKLLPVADVHFEKYVLQVGFDRGVGQVQPRGDLNIRFPSANEKRNILFTRRQGIPKDTESVKAFVGGTAAVSEEVAIVNMG